MPSLCSQCGATLSSNGRFCEACGFQVESTSLTVDAQNEAQRAESVSSPYASTYHVARTTAQIISAVGWIIVAFSALLLVSLIASERDNMARVLIVPSLGGTIGGLLLVAIG